MGNHYNLEEVSLTLNGIPLDKEHTTELNESINKVMRDVKEERIRERSTALNEILQDIEWLLIRILNRRDGVEIEILKAIYNHYKHLQE